MVGAGYVGLVSGACFADFGHKVTCIDTDADKVRILARGELPIYEPGLAEIVAANVRERRLSFATCLACGTQEADAVFIAVGTPSRREDGHADLSHVYGATRALAPLLPENILVVVKSTVPVGTADEVERIIAEERRDLTFDVASNPEFLRAGAAVADFKHPDRIVVGAEGDWARQILGEIYRPLFLNEAPMLYTSRRSAELIKYAANAFLATKIAFINEVSDLCEQVGADVQDVARGMGLDKRIGPQFLNAGPGFGGSCFPKDALALAKMAEDNGAPMRIIESTLAANHARRRAMGRKVAAAVGGSLRGKTVALLGLTFKPDTDDMREAPAIALVTSLDDLGARIRAYDPAGMDQAKAILPQAIAYCASPYQAAEGADALVVVTEWEQFRALDLGRLKRLMRAPLIVDLRNVYRAEDMASHGFRYRRIGGPHAASAPLGVTMPVSTDLSVTLRAAEHRERRQAMVDIRPKRKRQVIATAKTGAAPASS
jgi:UDPglucose 6-dehydrogenase